MRPHRQGGLCGEFAWAEKDSDNSFEDRFPRFGVQLQIDNRGGFESRAVERITDHGKLHRIRTSVDEDPSDDIDVDAVTRAPAPNPPRTTRNHPPAGHSAPGRDHWG